ncbi:MAG TPA: hypothetical protein VHY20_01330, partial [Pirellulales bacterium]|nr:hypothetical protein [Pirellulales bacterium]
MTFVWLLAAVLGGGLWLVGRFVGPLPSCTVPVLALSELLGALVAAWCVLRRPMDPVATARHVEAAYPELQAKLLTAAEQRRDDPLGRLGYLQTMVVGEAAAHGRRTGWTRV